MAIMVTNKKAFILVLERFQIAELKNIKSCKEIEKKISALDRAKLNALSAKISAVDYARITNYLKEDSQGEGIIKAISLLRLRLSNKDYRELRNIADKYIYMEQVEKVIESYS